MIASNRPNLEPDPRQTRVLVADDDDCVREVLVRQLEREGYKVEAAADGAEAIAAIDEGAFIHLVITDVRMPHKSGIDVMRAAKKRSPDTAVIIMTAYADCAAAIDAVREGAYDYLQKPFAYVGDVSTKIKRALREQKLELSNREMVGKLSEIGLGLEEEIERRRRRLDDSRALLAGRLRRLQMQELKAVAHRLVREIARIDAAAAGLPGDASVVVRDATAAMRAEIEAVRRAREEVTR